MTAAPLGGRRLISSTQPLQAMPFLRRFRCIIPIAVLAALAIPVGATGPVLPQLRQQGSAMQLIVDDQPFLVRGGELSNSHGEPDFLRPSWPKLKALNLNTVVAPVYWDIIEPVEGRFAWATVDGLLADARANGMRLVLLWFGSWKNSMSCYVPSWVKTDPARFPRARHPAADAAYAGPVPAELLACLSAHRDRLAPELRDRWVARGARTSGTWTEVFGEEPASAEIFMAWAFGRYVQTVAAAGKAEHPLPLYVNAALIRPAFQPGQYPSAGPLPHLVDLWRAAAPAIDFLSPDIYFPDFAEWADRYTRVGNPLFIPEALRSTDASVNSLYVFGACNGIGFAPFGIESIGEPAASLLKASNDLVAQLTPLITAHHGRGTMTALLPPAAEQRKPHEVSLGGGTLSVTYERLESPGLADGVINEAGDRPANRMLLPTGAIVIQLGPDEFLFGGIGVTITFAAPTPGDPQIGILSCAEGRYEAGEWRHIRWLNGDQTHQGRHVRLEPGRFTLQRVKLYRYR